MARHPLAHGVETGQRCLGRDGQAGRDAAPRNTLASAKRSAVRFPRRRPRHRQPRGSDGGRWTTPSTRRRALKTVPQAASSSRSGHVHDQQRLPGSHRDLESARARRLCHEPLVSSILPTRPSAWSTARCRGCRRRSWATVTMRGLLPETTPTPQMRVASHHRYGMLCQRYSRDSSSRCSSMTAPRRSSAHARHRAHDGTRSSRDASSQPVRSSACYRTFSHA